MNSPMLHNEIALMDQRRMLSGKEPTAAEL